MNNPSTINAVVIGGGVGGLSVAHELLKRGYNVTIVERSLELLGGKARSIEHCPTGLNFKLPAEHGFRFFPGFYGNITRTMKEIPLDNGGKSVYDNLVPVSYYTFLFTDGKSPIHIPVGIGKDIRRLKFRKVLREFKALKKVFDPSIIDITTRGQLFFFDRIFQLFTSCEERYLTEYERVPWEEFIEANNPKFGKDYKQFLAEGLTKNLVACRADIASTRTGGKILAHMIWQIANPFGFGADRVLNAPTNNAWLSRWENYLNKKYAGQLNIIKGKRVIRFILKKNPNNSATDDIDHITIEDRDETGKGVQAVHGDYFFAGIPIERLHTLISERSPRIFEIDPTLRLLKDLREHIEWMNGIIFYLNIDVPIADGHVTIADSDMAITIFSQTQYWQEYLKKNPLPAHDGKPILSVFSVIVSNWNAKARLVPDKKLKELTREQVVQEVWAQLKLCKINSKDPHKVFQLEDKDCFMDLTFVDDSLVPERGDPTRLFNKEPLLVNSIVTHGLRPEAHTRVRNLFIASDFVKTNSDLADMDTANEAARRAVNSFLLEEKEKGFCKTATYTLPTLLGILSLARRIDKLRYVRGVPWRPFKPLHLFLKYSYLMVNQVIAMPMVLSLPILSLYFLFFAILVVLNAIVLIFLSIVMFF